MKQIYYYTLIHGYITDYTKKSEAVRCHHHLNREEVEAQAAIKMAGRGAGGGSTVLHRKVDPNKS